MITTKTTLQKTQEVIEQPIEQQSAVWIWRSTQPIQSRQTSWLIIPIGNKVTTDAPHDNDWYIEVILFGKKVKLMTTE